MSGQEGGGGVKPTFSIQSIDFDLWYLLATPPVVGWWFGDSLKGIRCGHLKLLSFSCLSRRYLQASETERDNLINRTWCDTDFPLCIQRFSTKIHVLLPSPAPHSFPFPHTGMKPFKFRSYGYDWQVEEGPGRGGGEGGGREHKEKLKNEFRGIGASGEEANSWRTWWQFVACWLKAESSADSKHWFTPSVLQPLP